MAILFLYAESMDAVLHNLALDCKGFLDDAEGLRLYDLARDHASLGPVLEIGSYCGKSSLYLGAGARDVGGLLVCVDHHRGSEEHQPGEEYHDPELFDPEAGAMDSLGQLRRVLLKGGLEKHSVVIAAHSAQASRLCSVPLGMVFIDGGHSLGSVTEDYECWAPLVARGGILAIHDLFPDPSEGGQAPITVYRRALASGDFEELESTLTLGVLRKGINPVRGLSP